MGEQPISTATHQQTKAIANQLARTAGHVASIKRMVEEERPCPEVLVQIGAARAALNRVSRMVLMDHLESCLIGDVNHESLDQDLAELKAALDQYLR